MTGLAGRACGLPGPWSAHPLVIRASNSRARSKCLMVGNVSDRPVFHFAAGAVCNKSRGHSSPKQSLYGGRFGVWFSSIGAANASLNTMNTGFQSQPRIPQQGHRWVGAISFALLIFATVGVRSTQAGTNFTWLASFGTTTSAAANPASELIQAADGTFYGTTEYGGVYGYGTVFKVGPVPARPANNGLIPTTLFSFNGTNTGAKPRGPLAFGPDGNLYGTTYAGGTSGNGTVFVIATNGALNTLVSFGGTNGTGPCGALVFSTNAGGFCGATASGGAFTNGTVFSVTTNGVLTLLGSFDGGTNGAQPNGGVAQGPRGYLYGTASTGGSSGVGTIFSYRFGTNRLTAVYSFSKSGGYSPFAGLVFRSDGSTFYGTTALGGTNNGGTLFSGSVTNTTVTVAEQLWAFGGASGSNCYARPLVGLDGNVYGTVANGGTNNQGTLYSYGTNGSFAVLYSFRGGSQGSAPRAGLVQGPDANFYGVCQFGGNAFSLGGSMYELGGFAPYIGRQPTNIVMLTNMTGTLAISASGSQPLTYRWLQNTNFIGNNGMFTNTTTPVLTIHAPKTPSTNSYSAVVQNAYGSVTSTVVQVSIANTYGTNPPSLLVTSPALTKTNSIQTSALNIMVSGTAVGDLQTTLVGVYSLNGAVWKPVLLTGTRWSAGISLVAGTNVFQVYAQDSLNQYVTNTFFLIPATFVPVAGSYNGLWLATNGVVAATNAGAFNLSVSASGSYSGKLQVGGTAYGFSGAFSSNGLAHATSKSGQTTLGVSLALDLTPAGTGRVFGTVSNGAWQAALVGDIAFFDGKYNVCPQAGQYNLTLWGTNLTWNSTNLTLPGTNFALSGPVSSTQPSGGSFGTVTVSQSGIINFSASLSDNTTFSQSVPISKSGMWPLFVSLYNGNGLVWSWLSFPTNGIDTFKGDVAWIKSAAPHDTYYTNGFTVRATPLGQAYTPPITSANVFNSLTTNSADFVAIQGGLLTGITNLLTISPKNQVVNHGSSVTNLSLGFNASQGTYNGNFKLTPTGRTLSFRGVVLRETNSAGFFMGTNNQSGQVWITAP